MFRGHRFLLVAIGLVLAAHYPNAEAQPKQPDPQERSARALEGIASRYDEQTRRSDSSRETEQCRQGDDKRYSDLCAQWKAADAAADSAWWAAVGGFAGAVSAILVLMALWLAFRSNWIARDTAKRQLRAYISIPAALIKSDYYPVGQSYLKFSIDWKNAGQTPAHAVETYIEFVVADRGWRGFNEFTPPEFGKTKTNLGPGCIIQAVDVPIYLTDEAAWRSGACDIFIFTLVKYVDAFGQRRETNHRYVVKGDTGTDPALLTEDIGNTAT